MDPKESRFPAVIGLLLGGVVVWAAVAAGQTWFAAPRAGTASSVGLFSAANPSVLGQPLTLTATVTAAATGKVTFYDGATILGVAAIAGGQANFTTRGLPSGRRSLRAHYGGDGTFQGSDSAPLAQTVNALPANGFRQVVSAGTASASSPVVADFNGDGKADLALLQTSPSGVNYTPGQWRRQFSATSVLCRGYLSLLVSGRRF